jgi:hypothetical protein
VIAFALPFLFALITAYAALPGGSGEHAGGDKASTSPPVSPGEREYEPELVSQEGIGGPEDPFRGGRQHRHERRLYRDPQTRSRIVSFYADFTGSQRIAEIILEEAYIHEVPFSLAVSLAYVESSFNPRAVNVNYSSVDRGLFQLNNRSFPRLSEQEFFDPQTNAEEGITYLQWCLEHGENEIAALAMYNAGVRRVRERGAPKMTLDHIAKILTYRSKIEERFDTIFSIPEERSAAKDEEESSPRLANAVDSSPPAQ